MTRRNAITIAAFACVCVVAVANTLGSRGQPPCAGVLNGEPDPVTRIEVQKHKTQTPAAPFKACCTITDADRVAQIDAFLRKAASAWKPLDGAIAAEPVARYAIFRKSGSREEVVLIRDALVTPEWILQFSYNDYLMFEALIEDRPKLIQPLPPRASLSPLTWILNLIGAR